MYIVLFSFIEDTLKKNLLRKTSLKTKKTISRIIQNNFFSNKMILKIIIKISYKMYFCFKNKCQPILCYSFFISLK